LTIVACRVKTLLTKATIAVFRCSLMKPRNAWHRAVVRHRAALQNLTGEKVNPDGL
jgi:hypothetical protein